MKSLNEWLQENGEESLVESQVDQLVNRLVGILHDLDESEKTQMFDLFTSKAKERIFA